MMNIEPDKQLFGDVRQLIDAAKSRTVAAVNRELTLLYWHIGKRLDQEILRGERADYGKQVIASLSSMLTAEYGRGWSKRQLHYCLQFAQYFLDESIVHAVSAQLSWTHLRQIISLDDALKRDFYMEMCRLERWSTRQLSERIESQLYERTALSRKPEETVQHDIEQLRQEQQLSPSLLLKDPYVLDFLDLNDRYIERDLEDAILRELESFLLELGKGFTFIARQYRIQLEGEDYYIDLLLYNRKLRRLVAIELKTGRFRAEHKGQMEFYLRWLAEHEQEADEATPLGIILCADKNQEQIELLELDKSGIHVAEYLTVLPPRDVLQAKLQQSIQQARLRLEQGEQES
jgi:predicted nuclease of restriction endonuclease-like (RecB) superfamily